jgi:hypothetical protein
MLKGISNENNTLKKSCTNYFDRSCVNFVSSSFILTAGFDVNFGWRFKNTKDTFHK